MKLHLASLLLALLGFLSIQFAPLHGADATKPKGIPGHGKLEAADQSAQTVTLASKKGGRVFYVAADTKITDGAGSPSTLAAATVGEDVGVYYTKDATGKMTLISLRLGAKTGSKTASKATAAPAATAAVPAAAPAPAPAPAEAAPAAVAPAAATPTAATKTTKPKKQSFTGLVTAVDASTLSVHGSKADQTFTTSAATKVTGTIAVGAKVTVSYTKGDDGTMTAAAVKVK
jgi:hypothetical protein